MSEGIPETEDEAATRGTLLHAILLKDAPVPADLPEYDLEMLELARKRMAEWTKDCVTVKKEWFLRAFLGIEDDPFGTLDLAALGASHCAEKARLVDFKFGPNPLNPGFAEWQAMGYALMLFMEINQPRYPVRCEEIEAIIYHVPEDTTYTTIYRLEEMPQVVRRWKEVIAACGYSDSPLPMVLRPSPQACQWCRGAVRCPVASNVALQLVKSDLGQLALLTPEARGVLMDRAKIAESWIKRYKEWATAEAIKDPESVKGWKLRSRRNRELHVGAALMRARACLTPLELSYVVTTTMGRLEKALGKKEFAEKFADLIEEKERSFWLVKDTDKETHGTIEDASGDDE